MGLERNMKWEWEKEICGLQGPTGLDRPEDVHLRRVYFRDGDGQRGSRGCGEGDCALGEGGLRQRKGDKLGIGRGRPGVEEGDVVDCDGGGRVGGVGCREDVGDCCWVGAACGVGHC